MAVWPLALHVTLLGVLTGCASEPAPEPPPVLISAQTWQQIDVDIVVASTQAKGQAEGYARVGMEHWMDLVYQRTEDAFIPWYTSYWTQQWLTMKVAWYQLGADSTANRLTRYLQEEYLEQVLLPVAEELDPEVLKNQATTLYVQRLAEQLQSLPQRYRVPQVQFDQHLQGIPAISLAPPATRNASLYQLLHAQPSIGKLPAYVALIDRINQAGTRSGASAQGVSTVAQLASERLEAQVATRGASSSAAALMGKVAGMVLSVGVAGVGMVMHEYERPEMAVQVRQALNEAFDDAWLELLRNRRSGVLAGVYYLSEQVEGSLSQRVSLPLPAAGISAPGKPALQFNEKRSAEPVNYWEAFE